MPLSQTEYLWSGARPLLLISPARFFLYKGPKIDYFLTPPLDYRLLFNLVSRTTAPATVALQKMDDRSILAVISALRGHLLRGVGVKIVLGGSVAVPFRGRTAHPPGIDSSS